MASLGSGGESGGREELKSQFSTREGTYRLASAVEFARSTRPLAYVAPTNNTTPAPGTSPPVRISFVSHSSMFEQSRSNHDKTTVPGESGGGGSNRSSPESPVVNASSNMVHHGNEETYFTGSNGSASNGSHEDSSNPDVDSTPHRFCLNIGKELFIFPYMGIRKAVDMSKPIDKRIYKGTNPTCHDFNSVVASHDSLMLLIGFSGGQIQLVDPISKEVNKLYNEERVIDKTRVTSIRWVPTSTTLFMVSHASGHMYLYNVEHPSGTTAPHYQVHKTGPGFTISNCKSKTARNPLNRWTLGDGAINEFAFSPCGQYMAAASQDGFLRIFRYENCELVGLTRSYFGGLLCVCWSPDGKYICVGGEDDLVTMWSFKERRVVARGQGHKSWVSVVAFDPVTTTYGDCDDSEENGVREECSCVNIGKCHSSNDCQSSGVFSCDSVDTDSTTLQSSCLACQQISSASGGKQSLVTVNHVNNNSSSTLTTTTSSTTNSTSVHTCTPNFPRHSRHSRTTDSMRLSISESSNNRVPVCYRVGSVGQDTQICLWDLTEDVIKQPFGKSRPASRTPGKHNSDTNSCAIHSNSKNYSSNQNIMPNHNCTTSTCKSHSDKDDSVGVGNNISVNNASVSTSNVNLSSSSSSATAATTTMTVTPSTTNGNVQQQQQQQNSSNNSSSGHGLLSLRFGALSFGGGDKDRSKDKDTNKEHKRNFSLGSSSNSKSDKNAGSSSKANLGGANSGLAALGLNIDKVDDPIKLIGTQACPRLDECPLLEPLICKKISHERLTTLIFREESIVTICQDGILCTWARPGDAVSQL
ncbi:WD repeat-containing protein 20 [Folsomia candida]|uniref:WD repeat-containing protein 20 n=1 Tax=Folsomia candida TaxID=158441 RepID=UPI000B901A05|nr:WD repeat-containing protein 20 [Folsomia candida]